MKTSLSLYEKMVEGKIKSVSIRIEGEQIRFIFD